MPRTVISTEVELDVEVEYSVKRGSGEYFSRGMQQWYPGEPDEVTIDDVTTTIDGKVINVKHLVDIEQLKQNILDEVVQ